MGDTDGYDTTDLRHGGYGAWTVNYSNANGHQYHFFSTFHSNNYDYQADVQWPIEPFNPSNPSPNYTILKGQDINQTWSCIGITRMDTFTRYSVIMVQIMRQCTTEAKTSYSRMVI